MIRTVLAVWVGACIAVVGLSVAAFAEPNVSGAWRVDFVTPLGQTFVNMYIAQSGTRLSGHATDEFGEYAIEGRVTDDQVTVVWEVPEDGKMLEITMKGKLEGNVITGTAKLGDVGEGPLTARRTGDGDDQRSSPSR